MTNFLIESQGSRTTSSLIFLQFNRSSCRSCPHFLQKKSNVNLSFLEFKIILAESLINKFSSQKKIYQPIEFTTIM